MQKLIIPHPLPTFNTMLAQAIKGINSWVMHKTKWTGIVQAYAEKLSPVKNYPVNIRFDWYVAGHYDHGNIRAAEKFITDALVNAGILIDDGPRYINNYKGDYFHDEPDNPRVEVTIYEPGEDEDVASSNTNKLLHPQAGKGAGQADADPATPPANIPVGAGESDSARVPEGVSADQREDRADQHEAPKGKQKH